MNALKEHRDDADESVIALWTALAAPQAAVPAESSEHQVGASVEPLPLGLDEGELWSWTRSVMSQGAYIQQDYASGEHANYEVYSAHLDAAAAKRAEELGARIAAIEAAKGQSCSD